MSVWDTLESVFPVLKAHMREAARHIPSLARYEVGMWERLEDFFLFDHHPINGERVTQALQRRSYLSADYLDAWYAYLVDTGYAQLVGEDAFVLTGVGKQLYQRMMAQKAEAYAQVRVMPETEFEGLVRFLQQGYTAAVNTPLLTHKPSMQYGYRYYTDFVDGGQLGTLWSRINLFELFRDDIHAATWRMMGFSAIEIETLTVLWRDGTQTAASLADMLVHRGYCTDDYAQTLDELRWLGYAMPADGCYAYALTLDGRHVRSGIEAETNMRFDTFCQQTFSDQAMCHFQRAIDSIQANTRSLYS